MACANNGNIYEYAASNGVTYNYQFDEPVLRNQNRLFFGTARVWKKGGCEKDFFNVQVHDNVFNSNQRTDDAIKGIEFHISQIG